jgi:hypothetical protein
MARRLRRAIGDILPALLVHAAFAAALVSIAQVLGRVDDPILPLLP